METKQHKDSVIARLMGLDEVPPQQTIHKRQRVLSENYLRRSASIGLREGSSFRLVKDVFDEHVSKKDEHNIMPVLDKEASYSASKTQMGMGRKKNASATILQSIPGHSYNYEGIFNKKRKQHARGNVLRSLQKREKDSFTGHFEELGFDPINKLKSRLEMVDQPHLFSTSFVMLDPNSQMEKRKSIHIMSDLLPRSGDRDHDESLEPENRELLKEFTYMYQAVNGMDSSTHSYSDCKEIKSRISLQGSSCQEASRPQFSGENYLMNERESLVASYPGFFNCEDQKHALYPSSNGSSLAREVYKQIFQWQKRTKKVQTVESAGRAQNLGEMLAMSDWELTLRNMNLELDSLQGKNLDSGSASGISSKDGWKNQVIVCSPNSKVEVLCETCLKCWHLRQEEAAFLKDNKLRKQKISQKDDLDYRGSSGSEKFQSCLDTLKNKCTILQSPTTFQSSRCNVSWLDSENNNPAAHEKVVLMIQDEWANGPNMNDGSRDNQHDSRVSNSTIGNLASQSTVDILVNAEAENIEISTVHKLQKSEPNPGILSIKDRHSSSHVMETFTGQFSSHSSSHDWEALNGQVSSTSYEISKEAAASSNCLRIGLPELYSNLKGTNQCSPHSTLEPFEEDNSLTSEYFENVTTDLHSQQLQLQLPKSESEETYSEGSGFGVFSDSDTDKRSHDPSEDGGKLLRLFGDDESRDFSYLIDVLDEARFQGLNLDMDFETWHSLECPASPSVFEAIEKKYGKQTSWQKPHRQLLFNRINYGLREIFNPYIHFHMSTPLRRRCSDKLTRDDIEEELWMFLISQEEDESKGLFEKALGKEMKWLDLDEDIDNICRELETHLFDDLVLELVLFGIVE